MLDLCWAIVCDAGPTYTQHWRSLFAVTGREPVLSLDFFVSVTERAALNPFEPEFTIVIFIHYKPRVAAAILDL